MNLKELKSLKLDEIVSIESVGIQHTYDFTIPKKHCFIANDILVHNSGVLEEHSDTAMLLYWTKRNEPLHNSPNDYECNIAKQRHGATMNVNLYFEPQYYRIGDRPATAIVEPQTNRGVYTR